MDQVQNALRSADNSKYGETIMTGMVVPLNADTKASDVYDPAGMRVTSDGAGNNYLVQDPSTLGSPSQSLRDLIQESTGGANSPYSWNVASPEAAQAPGGPPRIDPNGPFAPGWNTGDYSAGLGTRSRGLLPDYATASTGALSGTTTVATNLYDFRTYLAGGVSQGDPRSISFRPGGSATFGWILGEGSAASTNSFLKGDGNQVYVSIPTPWGVNAFLGITHSYGGGNALELGIANPGKLSAGVVPVSHSTQVLGGKDGQ